MNPTLVDPELETPPELDRGGGGGFEDIGSDGGGDRGRDPASRFDTYQTVVWVLMIPIVMLFAGLTSSLVVRKGISDDWISIQIPKILWLNTLVLLSSSAALEIARRALRRRNHASFRVWLWLTAALGTLFLLGQIIAWRELAAQGAFLSSNPSSSFFYVLTASHGAHLIGGMTALIYLTIRVFRNQFGARRRSALRATAVYWHFMDGLWIYLIALLIFWR
jgi:cytochrome c oxidase subunit III